MTDEPIAPTDRFTVSEDVVLERIEEELVLLDLTRDTYFSINPVGAVIWEVLAEGGDVEQAVEAILADYDVDRQTATDDVEAFVRHALQKELFAREAP